MSFLSFIHSKTADPPLQPRTKHWDHRRLLARPPPTLHHAQKVISKQHIQYPHQLLRPKQPPPLQSLRQALRQRSNPPRRQRILLRNQQPRGTSGAHANDERDAKRPQNKTEPDTKDHASPTHLDRPQSLPRGIRRDEPRILPKHDHRACTQALIGRIHAPEPADRIVDRIARGQGPRPELETPEHRVPFIRLPAPLSLLRRKGGAAAAEAAAAAGHQVRGDGLAALEGGDGRPDDVAE